MGRREASTRAAHRFTVFWRRLRPRFFIAPTMRVYVSWLVALEALTPTGSLRTKQVSPRTRSRARNRRLRERERERVRARAISEMLHASSVGGGASLVPRSRSSSLDQREKLNHRGTES